MGVGADGAFEGPRLKAGHFHDVRRTEARLVDHPSAEQSIVVR